MKNVHKIDLGLTGYDELFMNDSERQKNRLPRIYDIPISEIDDFPDHPFKVKVDEDMDQLVQSIKERGIITPVTLRPKEDGRYEIVSGHRRKKACELAGLDTIKAEVREMTRDEAIILMVESNLQRSTILPSEKAFSYKMRLEAMNRQGQRNDLTCGPVDHKLEGMKSRDIIADSTNDSARQVSRYIRLLDGIYDLILEVVVSKSPMTVIASNEYPTELVRSKFLKLTSMHVEYVLDCFNQNSTKVRNIKKYLLAALFNAPSTISGYYTAEVHHDMPYLAAR